MEYINKIIQEDTLEVMRTMPDACVDCVITSPPYWNLRRYLNDDHPQKSKEIGLEPNLQEWLQKMFTVFQEVQRILKPTGSLWLNCGDSYGTGSGAGSRAGTKQATNHGSSYYEDTGKMAVVGYEKSLLGQPWRLALKMIDEGGWILRSDVIWAKQVYLHNERRTKGSAMPSSVKDRFNMTYEHLFHFVKNKKYYFDLDAVRLKHQKSAMKFNMAKLQEGIQYKNVDGKEGIWNTYTDKKREIESMKARNTFNYRVPDAVRKDGQPQFTATEKEIKNYRKPPPNKGNTAGHEDKYAGLTAHLTHDGFIPNTNENPNGKNLPSVWLIGVEPSKELHFAKFPTALCEIPIKTTTPPDGIVFDPFMGSGTTAVMARRLGRKYCGVELNAEFIKIAEKRLAQQQLF